MKNELARFAKAVGIPAVGAALLRDGEVTQLAVTGVQRRNDSVPVVPDDVWHIGSCMKMITAMVFARLVERGVASWEMPLQEIFSDLATELHSDWNQCTVDQLFYCSSGMRANPPQAAMRRLWRDERALREQRTDMAVFAMQSPSRKRGAFRYSNLGYIVIGAAIDRLAGTSFETALKEEIADPLGVSSLGYGPPPALWGHGPGLRLGPLMVFKGKPSSPNLKRSDNPAVFASAGTLHLSLADWAKIVGVFCAQDSSVLEQRSIDRILTAPSGNPMSMGWGVPQIPGVCAAAQGSNTQWSATVMLSEDRRQAVMVACNDGRSRVLFKSVKLAETLLHGCAK